MEDMLDHLERVAQLVGVEHVGIGSDVDLVGHSPRANEDLQGIEYSRRFFEITEGLVRRKYNADQIRGIIGANFERAFPNLVRFIYKALGRTNNRISTTINTSPNPPLG